MEAERYNGINSFQLNIHGILVPFFLNEVSTDFLRKVEKNLLFGLLIVEIFLFLFHQTTVHYEVQ